MPEGLSMPPVCPSIPHMAVEFLSMSLELPAFQLSVSELLRLSDCWSDVGLLSGSSQPPSGCQTQQLHQVLDGHLQAREFRHQLQGIISLHVF